ncbi:MAG: hypothetical protein JOY66_15390, partial [Acetobacteraceae bacterium]|nr:hypothetical protein [Acetobacteraceae bacterium]
MRLVTVIVGIGLIACGLALVQAGDPPADDARDGAAEAFRVAVDGPLPEDKPVRIVAAESPFVAPGQIEAIRLGPNTTFVVVRFEFKGPERPSRRIEVKLTALGPGDKVIAEGTHTCSDQRVYARRKSGKRRGTRVARY